MRLRTWTVAALWPLAALAAPTPQLEIADPAGDDVGDGRLVYPRDSAFQSGDLDLRVLRVHDEGDALRFEAGFENAVRHPATVQARGVGNESLSVFARRGFYAFNLDVYVRGTKAGPGAHGVGLPGRGVGFAPGQGWDRVVVLTPRPELMRRQLREALTDALPQDAAAAEAAIDAAVHFASAVRVRGRNVEFTVPKAFFGASEVPDWSVTALVTQARLAIQAELPLQGLGVRTAGPSLGVQAPQPGRPEEAMGYGGERAPATSVVDLLDPDPRVQGQALTTGAQLSGLGRAGLPVAGSPSAAAGEPTWFARALQAVAQGPAVAAAPVPATAPARAAVAPARDATDPDAPEQRLLLLQRLRDRGLITEAEYQSKRQQVLDRL